MQIVNDLKKILAAVEGKNKLSVIIQEASKGLELYFDLSSEEILRMLNGYYKQHGSALKFRLFNADLDANWLGHYGIVIDEPIDQQRLIEVYLESDTKRHPGMAVFGAILNSLKNHRLQAQLVDDGRYLRLGNLIREVE
jgi:hypothetical protein